MMRDIVFLEEVSSTNDYMRELIAKSDNLADGFAVVAEYQTAGRGQAQNVWESERGKNLTFSMAFFPDFLPVREQFLVSQAVSLGIVDFLCEYCQIGSVSIKWPNDIYWMDSKICGILIENTVSGRVIDSSVVGIGLNVNQYIFESDAPNPISVCQITGGQYNLESFFEVLREKILQRYAMLCRGEMEVLRRDYFRKLYRATDFFLYEDAEGRFRAKIEDVEPIGTLVLRLESGELRKYAFKEVAFEGLHAE